MRARRRSSCRPSSRRRSWPRRSSSIARSSRAREIFAEALDYFPAVDAFVGTADRYLERARTDQGAVGGSGHRESERQHRRRMGPLCAAHPGRGSGRARTERVPHGRRPGPHGGRHGDGRPGAHRGRPCVHRNSARRQAQSVLLRVRQLRRSGGRCRRRRSRAVQSLLSAGSRPRYARCRPPARVEPVLGDAAAGALDRGPPTAARPRRVPGRDIRRPHRGGTWSRV